MHFENFDNSHNSFLWPEYFIDFICERCIPYQAVTFVLCLHYHPETVHCSIKDANTSEITFFALVPCIYLTFTIIITVSCKLIFAHKCFNICIIQYTCIYLYYTIREKDLSENRFVFFFKLDTFFFCLFSVKT